MERQTVSWRWYYYSIPPFLLACITALVYYPSLRYEFQFDDIANITKHFNIRHYNLSRLFFSGPRWISYWLNSLNYSLGKFEPFFYRLFNVSFHIINGLLIFCLILYALSRTQNNNFFKKNALYISTITALLFLLHPVQTQTVSYVIQGQLEGLACMAIISMCLLLVLYAHTGNRFMQIFSIIGLYICAFLACGTKEIAIIAPCLVLLVDWFLIAQGQWASLKKRLWIHVSLFLFMLSMYLYLLKPRFFIDIIGFRRIAKNNIGNVITHTSQALITPWSFCISQFKVILHYVWIFLWPFSLSVEYDWKLSSHFFAADAFIPFLTLVGIGILIGMLLRAQAAHLIAFGLLWFFICIAPRSSIIPSPELLVDYKTYTASIGWLFVIACGIIYIFLNVHKKLQQSSILAHHAITHFMVSTFIIGSLLSIGTIRRNQVWRSGLEFWENIIKNAPNKARAYNNYGVELSQKLHKFEESIPYFKKAISMDDHYPDPCNNLAVAYSQIGKIDLAIEALKKGIRINPYYPEGYNNLASFYVQQKKFDTAEKILKTALRLRPHYGKAHFNLGRVYLEQNEPEKAWECFKACCMNADLDNEFGFLMYAKSSMALKKYDDAVIAFTRLLECKPDDYDALFNLANAYCLVKKHAQAIPLYEQLRSRNPNDLRILYNFAEAQLALNNTDQALAFFAQLKPYEKHFPHINIRMAACYEKMGHIAMAQSLLRQLAYNSAAPDPLRENAQTLITELNKKYKIKQV